MAKTDNPSLAKIACGGCDGQADIKRKRTGKKLLYLHCTNCGLDQRSGAKLQARWQGAINGTFNGNMSDSENTETLSEISHGHIDIATELTTDPSTNRAANSPSDEWQPQRDIKKLIAEATTHDDSSTEKRTDSDSKEPGQRGDQLIKWLGLAAGTLLVIARVRS